MNIFWSFNKFDLLYFTLYYTSNRRPEYKPFIKYMQFKIRLYTNVSNSHYLNLKYNFYFRHHCIDINKLHANFYLIYDF